MFEPQLYSNVTYSIEIIRVKIISYKPPTRHWESIDVILIESFPLVFIVFKYIDSIL